MQKLHSSMTWFLPPYIAWDGRIFHPVQSEEQTFLKELVGSVSWNIKYLSALKWNETADLSNVLLNEPPLIMWNPDCYMAF